MAMMVVRTVAKASSSLRPTGSLLSRFTGASIVFGSEGVGQGADEAALVAVAQHMLVGVVPADIDSEVAGQLALHAHVPGGVLGPGVGDPLAKRGGRPCAGVEGDAALRLDPP